MNRWPYTLLLFAAASLAQLTESHAARPALGLFRERPATAPKSTPPADRQTQWDPRRPHDASWFQPEMYPKYYGGFHYRAFEIYDSPSGQRGMRGTAW